MCFFYKLIIIFFLGSCTTRIQYKKKSRNLSTNKFFDIDGTPRKLLYSHEENFKLFSNDYVPENIELTSNNTILIVGRNNIINNEIFYLEISRDFETIFQKFIKNENYKSIPYSIKSFDNSIFITGDIINSNLKQGFRIKIENNEIKWSNKFYSDKNISFLNSFAIDGITIAVPFSLISNLNVDDLSVIQISDSIVYSVLTFNLQNNQSFHTIEKSLDNQKIISSGIQDNPNKIIIKEFSFNTGTVSFYKAFFNNNTNYITKILRTSFNKYIFSGYIQNNNSNSLIFSLTNLGNLDWAKELEHVNETKVIDTLEIDTKIFLLIKSGIFDLILAVIDRYGNLLSNNTKFLKDCIPKNFLKCDNELFVLCEKFPSGLIFKIPTNISSTSYPLVNTFLIDYNLTFETESLTRVFGSPNLFLEDILNSNTSFKNNSIQLNNYFSSSNTPTFHPIVHSSFPTAYSFYPTINPQKTNNSIFPSSSYFNETSVKEFNDTKTSSSVTNFSSSILQSYSDTEIGTTDLEIHKKKISISTIIIILLGSVIVCLGIIVLLLVKIYKNFKKEKEIALDIKEKVKKTYAATKGAENIKKDAYNSNDVAKPINTSIQGEKEEPSNKNRKNKEVELLQYEHEGRKSISIRDKKNTDPGINVINQLIKDNLKNKENESNEIENELLDGEETIILENDNNKDIELVENEDETIQ